MAMASRWIGRTSGMPRTAPWFVAVAVGVLLAMTTGALATAPAPRTPSAVSPAGSVVLTLTATSSISFVPDTLNVPATGDAVELEITQEYNMNHTFTLSSVDNDVIPTSDTPGQLYAYFAAHTPLVNVSLGDVVGHVTFVNFTAPANGSYEFVCEIPTHFQAGMHGTLVVGGSSSSSSSGLTTTELVVIVVVVIIVIAAVVALAMRRKPKSAAPPPAANP